MRTVLAAAAVMIALGTRTDTQSAVEPVNGLPNPYETIRNWGTLPAGRTWGSTAGIDIDPDGRSIWAYDRCGANSCAGSTLDPILKFDASGRLVKSFGAGTMIFPHGFQVDKEGNVWVTDERSASPDELKKFPDTAGKGNRVIKFSPDGKVLLTIGKGGAPGDPPESLNEPCDVILAPNGDILISEGHSGQNPQPPPGTVGRISVFSKDGKFIRSFGKFGSGPGEFRTPHAMVFDQRGRLIVADRGNVRLQVFDQNYKFIEEWKQFSRVSGLFITRNDMLYAIDSESSPERHPNWKTGVRIGTTKEDKVLQFIPPHALPTGAAQGAAGEGVAVDADGNVFGAEGPISRQAAGGGLTKYAK
jgi:DNA-binding beta-propeller fold protein YncE